MNAVVFVLSVIVTFITRKVFLDYLGDDLVGLSSMMVSILAFFALADLSIISAGSYALYKPIFDEDKSAINKLMSVFDYLYRKVGLVVLAAGLALSLFLVLIFKNSNVEIGVVYTSFFVFLFSALLGYLLNYKQIILIASQRNYITMSYMNVCNLVKFCIQALCLIYTSWGYFLWLFWEALFALFNSFLLRRKVKKDYAWLNTSYQEGRIEYKSSGELFIRARQVFSHNFASQVQLQMPTLLIYAFTTLSFVTVYANYLMITSKLTQFIYMIFSNSSATIGNLIAEDNKPKIYRVFWQWTTMYYLLGFTIVFTLYRLTNPFISLWIGAEYLVDRWSFIMILITVFLTLIRNPIDSYLAGYGLYKDTWSTWTAAAVNLISSVIAVRYFGLSGILFGTALSTFMLVMIWKPYFLFRNGFRCHIYNYIRNMAVIIVGGVVIFFGLDLLFNILLATAPTDFLTWLAQAIIVTSSIFVLYFCYLYAVSRSMRELVQLCIELFHKRFPQSGR